ncbi:MAG: 50S ribosomal protein L11 methyltransferase [Opitutae bacterium]|nr:50S ribosomal protein L11 methyltransferase [Opitutae bacterium]
MLKVSSTVNQKYLLELEGILFEAAPSPWSLILNRKTKILMLEGIFENKEQAEKEIQKINELLPLNIDQNKIGNLDESWEKAYKNHFQPWIYKDFKFVPEWERKPLDQNTGLSCIYIDPGMAFGTGTHETTRLCIELMVDIFYQKSLSKDHFLDVGCGSGILSILAQIVGFQNVLGIDNDGKAIINSEHNLSLNFESSKINFMKKCINTIEENSFNCIVANIQADVLMTHSDRLIRSLYKNGNMILSGILDYEVDEVSRTFQKQLTTNNLDATTQTRKKNEWCALHIELN